MITIIAEIIQKLLKDVSPEIRGMIKDFLVELKIKAEATSNPWDDVLINFVLAVMGFTEEVSLAVKARMAQSKIG